MSLTSRTSRSEGSWEDKYEFHSPHSRVQLCSEAGSTLTGKDIFVSVFALIFRPLALLSALLHLCLQLLESLSETDTVYSGRLLSLCGFHDVT